MHSAFARALDVSSTGLPVGIYLTSILYLVYILLVPRIELLERPSYEFLYELTVQVGHLDHAGHLGHDAIVSIAHDVRVHMFHTLGARETNLGDGNTGIIIGDLVATYINEGYLFDRLRIESHIGEMKRSDFRVFQRITRDGSIIALVETGTITFNYKTRTIVPIPDVFRKALESFLLSVPNIPR